MAGDRVTGQRRIDRILDDAYLDGLSERSTDDIRRMRDECEEEESGLSYARRILQGRLDIVRAEVVRRRDAGNHEAGPVLDRLPSILGDASHTSEPAHARAPRFLVPPSAIRGRRDLDRVADEDNLSDLPGRSMQELTDLVDSLAEREHDLSTRRRSLLDRIDRLQDELIQRYKTGAADVSDVLASGV
jgi:hypothetical protein